MKFSDEVVFVEQSDAEALKLDKTLSWIEVLRRDRCQWPIPITRLRLGSGWRTTSRKQSGVEFADGWSAGGEEGVEVKAWHGLDLFPASSHDDVVDGGRRDAKSFGDCSSPSVFSERCFRFDDGDLFFGEDRIVTVAPHFFIASAFVEAVAHVVLDGSSEQVGWIAAWRIVAGVTCQHLWCEWSVAEFVSEAMALVSLGVEPDHSVSIAGFRVLSLLSFGPSPAFVFCAFVDAVPEALDLFC